MTDETNTKHSLLPVEILGFRVYVAAGDAEAFQRVAAGAIDALRERPEILTRLDAVERERTRLRQLVMAADQACKTALTELTPRELT